ncbi:TMEM175 family protein [uncultured Methanobacterium sp.]|uniref:TMEM175 family protein n=1 Tax=uncultured Methanobacterium sp. TaxID=176306 RepID=UPI002AA7B0D5|nr:TMEM175 family protein [uncultured Methanobacterium sp.]
MPDKNAIKSTGINAKRIETLVDGVFAIAMTLLVLGITVPSIANPTEAGLYQALINLLPNFYSYFISFILLAVFWRINHNQFNRIKRADGTLLWIIIIWLLFVALLPFSAFFIGEYGNFRIPNIFFDLNLFAIGFLLFLNWRHALNSGLVDGVDDEMRRTSLRLNLILPVISLLALGVTYLPFMKEVGYAWSSLVYLIIPLMKRFY